MAAQTNNLMLLDLTSGIPRTIDSSNDSIEIGVPLAVNADMSVGGDLTVQGDIVSRGQVDVVIQDSFLDLGFGNSTDVAAAGGFTVSMNRNSGFTAGTVTAFTANSGSGASFTYTDATGSTLLVAGDVVAIKDAADGENDGIYIVDSVDQASFPQAVIVKGGGSAGAISGDCPWAQNAFKTATGQTASAYKIDLAVVALADGVNFDQGSGSPWPKGTFVTAYESNATMAAFEVNGAYASVGEVDLQEAYVTGNVITTSAANGIVSIAGDQSLNVSANGGIIAGGAGLQVTGTSLNVDTAVDVDLTGAFAVDGNQAVSFGSAAQVASYSIDTVGAFSVLADAASSVRVDGANLTMQTATSGSIIANSAGDFDVIAGIMDVNLTGALEIDAAAVSNITVDGANLTVATTTSGSLILDAVALMDMNAGAGMDIDVTGSFDMLSSGAFSIDGSGASNVSATSGNLSLETLTGGNVDINSAGDITADGAKVDITATGAIELDSAANSWFKATGADLTLQTVTSGTLLIDSAGILDVNAASMDLDSAGAVQIDAAAGSHFEVAGADLIMGTNTSGKLQLKAAGLLDIDAGANADIDVTGNVELDATGLISLDGVGNSNFTADQGNLTIATTTSGNLVANSAGSLDIDAATAITIDSANNGVSIDGAAASNFSTSAGALTLDGNAGVNIAGNAAEIDVTTTGALDLNSGAGTWNASTLIVEGSDNVTIESFANDGADKALTLRAQNAGLGHGALTLRADNEITIGDGGDNDSNIFAERFVTLKRSAGLIGETAGESLSMGDSIVAKWDAGNSELRWYKADANAVSDNERAVHGVAVAAAAAAGDDVDVASVLGTGMVTKLSGLTGTDSGKPIYLSATAGDLTLTPPTGSGNTVFRVGYVLSHNGGPSGVAMMLFSPQFIAKRP